MLKTWMHHDVLTNHLYYISLARDMGKLHDVLELYHMISSWSCLVRFLRTYRATVPFGIKPWLLNSPNGLLSVIVSKYGVHLAAFSSVS